MINLTNIDIDKPIFVHSLDIEHVSRQRAEEIIKKAVESYENSDIQVVIIPTRSESKFECVYGGKYHSLNTNIFQNIIEKLEEEKNQSITNPLRNEIIDILKNLKILTERNHLINDLL